MKVSTVTALKKVIKTRPVVDSVPMYHRQPAVKKGVQSLPRFSEIYMCQSVRPLIFVLAEQLCAQVESRRP